jgi:hypothetical protein
LRSRVLRMRRRQQQQQQQKSDVPQPCLPPCDPTSKQGRSSLCVRVHCAEYNGGTPIHDPASSTAYEAQKVGVGFSRQQRVQSREDVT